MSATDQDPLEGADEVQQPITIDDAVARHFPEGSTFLTVKSDGARLWTRTARIELELADSSPHRLFLKMANGDLGMSMLRGEFHGAEKLHKYTPGGTPRPIAWGTFESDPNTHFLLSEYIDIVETLPDIRNFSSMLAKLHHDSMVSDDSPGQYGFHVMTHEGTMYQDVTFCDTWEEFFQRRLQSFIDQELIAHGPSPELDEILPHFMSKVIPRLLRPMSANGRSIKPTILHGNIWNATMGTNASTGEPVYFDPAVFWGHHEYDLGNMSTPRYRLGRHWMREYHRFFPISAPEDDYEDRITLYAISGHFCASTLYPDNDNFRRMAIDDMKRLLEKYPDGYHGE